MSWGYCCNDGLWLLLALFCSSNPTNNGKKSFPLFLKGICTENVVQYMYSIQYLVALCWAGISRLLYSLTLTYLLLTLHSNTDLSLLSRGYAYYDDRHRSIVCWCWTLEKWVFGGVANDERIQARYSTPYHTYCTTPTSKPLRRVRLRYVRAQRVLKDNQPSNWIKLWFRDNISHEVQGP